MNRCSIVIYWVEQILKILSANFFWELRKIMLKLCGFLIIYLIKSELHFVGLYAPDAMRRHAVIYTQCRFVAVEAACSRSDSRSNRT